MTITLPADPDLYERATLETLLAPLRSFENAIVDLREAPYITSEVLTALYLLHLHRTTAGLPPMRIICTSSFVRRILHAVQFDHLFPIVQSMGEAMDDTLEAPHSVRRA